MEQQAFIRGVLAEVRPRIVEQRLEYAQARLLVAAAVLAPVPEVATEPATVNTGAPSAAFQLASSARIL